MTAFKSSSPLLLVLVLTMVACQFNNSRTQGTDPSRGHFTDTLPDNIGENDLMELLQGHWASDSLPEEQLDIQEDRIKVYQNRQLVQTGLLMIDSHCTLDACFDSLMLDNWCFIVQDEAGRICFRVLHCSTDTLRFQEAGTDGRIRRFLRQEK